MTSIDVIDLERIAARGWQGTHTLQIGDWLLRAGSGFTGRANSVLPLGPPGRVFPDALGWLSEAGARCGSPNPTPETSLGASTRATTGR